MSKKLIDKLQDIDVATALDGDRLCMDTYTANEIIVICKEHYRELAVDSVEQVFNSDEEFGLDELIEAINDALK